MLNIHLNDPFLALRSNSSEEKLSNYHKEERAKMASLAQTSMTLWSIFRLQIVQIMRRQ